MSLIVRGGQRLRGTVAVAGSKNAFHKLIAACVAVAGTHRLASVPSTGDADALLSMAETLGADIRRSGSVVTINSRRLNSVPLRPEATLRSTGSFLFAGALLGRLGHITIGPPGGDKVGVRPVDRHLSAFESLGAYVERSGASYSISSSGLMPGRVNFSHDTVNGTANALLAAIGIQGVTRISKPSIDPDVLALIDFLRSAGYEIKVWSDHIEIEGIRGHEANTAFAVPPDRNDAMTLLVAGALCGGTVTLTGISAGALSPALSTLKMAGVSVEEARGSLVVHGERWVPGPAIQVESGPFPGFLTDWGPLVQVLMTQLNGESTFIERVFSDRLRHVEQLRKMGALIDTTSAQESARLNEPFQTARFSGPTTLHGAVVLGTDLRGTAALLIAGLIASGITQLDGTSHLARGYEDLVPRLKALGADISEV